MTFQAIDLAATARLDSIDQFRGFAILLMVLADYLSDVNRSPAWLKHVPDVGYTIIDLIAPMFLFAIGLTYGLSFRRRLAHDGARKTYEHAILAALAAGLAAATGFPLAKRALLLATS